MAVKFNFRGTVNTLAGHKRNLANTKKRNDAVRKIQTAYRAALERRRKRAAATAAPATVVVNKPKKVAAKPKAKAKKKSKQKNLKKSKVRALLKLNRPALEKKFQDTRKLAKKLACGGDKNFPVRDRSFGPKEIKKLGLTNRELVDMIRRTEQSCFTGESFSRIPTKRERKYFAGANMSNNAKTNKNYVPNNNENNNLRALGWERFGATIEPIDNQALKNFRQGNMSTGRIPKLPNEYFYTNDPEINNAKKNTKTMNVATLRAYLRNQIINRFGVDPNKNERFIRLNNWRNYSATGPNWAKTAQYANTLRQPGKLAAKKSNPTLMNWVGTAVPTTGAGRRQRTAQTSGVLQRSFAKQILNDLDRNNITWTKNLSDNDKRYAKRLINTHGRYSNKLMTNAVANNIIKRFGKRASRAARKDANKRRANNFKTFIESKRFPERANSKYMTKNEWLKGMGMNNEFLKKIGI